MGREIAAVMGHQGADWLDRPTREAQEHTSQLVETLSFRAGEVVADIGAGTGYITEKIARQIGPAGLVYATDIQPEMLERLEARLHAKGLSNVRGSLGKVDDAGLAPDSVDTILLVDVYHELDHPYEMTRSMIAGLRPGGRLVLVEFRAEDPKVPIKATHKMTEAQVRKEMLIHPELEHAETISSLPWQHAIIFRKRPATSAEDRASHPSPQSAPVSR
jgi:ubiquinone/menaquinone biosynthesis C-methylase UbiE